MPAIEVGDLVERKTTVIEDIFPPVRRRIYLVVEIEKREHSDGRPILGLDASSPSWCKLHDDEDRLTAVNSLTLVQKGRK